MYKIGCWLRISLIFALCAAFSLKSGNAQTQSANNLIPVLNHPEPFTQYQLLQIWEMGFSKASLYFDGTPNIGHNFCLSNRQIIEEGTGKTLAELKLLEIVKEPILTDGSGLIPYLYILNAEIPNTKQNSFFDDWEKNSVGQTSFIGIMLFLDPNGLVKCMTGDFYNSNNFKSLLDLYIYPHNKSILSSIEDLNDTPLYIIHYYLSFPEKISDCSTK